MQIKRHLSGAAALLLGMACGTGAVARGNDKPPDNLVARIHFMGTAQIAADKQAVKLNEIRAVHESGALWNEIVEKLATTPFRVMNQNSPPRKNNHAELMRPLVEDMLRSESYVEMQGTNELWPEVAVAIKLDNQRAELWKGNLAKALTDWTGISVTDIQMDGFQGWELKKHHNPNLFRFFRAESWVVFGWGQDELKLLPAILEKIKAKQRPVATGQEHWLDAWIDWPALEGSHPNLIPVQLPKMDLVVDVRPDFLRPKMKLSFAEPLGMKIEPWRFPTNLICNSLCSVTVARGFGPFLSKDPTIRNLNAEPVPNQGIMWAQTGFAYPTCVALPAADAKNYLMRIAPGLISLVNSDLTERHSPGKAVLTTNLSLAITGLPMLSPFLFATNRPEGDFLIGGIFALPPTVEPFPWNSLFGTISPDNVIYYDREMNGERMTQWRTLSQLYFMTTARTLPKTDSPAQNWLMAIQSKLEDCRTIGMLTAPNEITVVRNAPIGLTGFEMTLVALWVDGPEFPLGREITKAVPVDVSGRRPIGR